MAKKFAREFHGSPVLSRGLLSVTYLYRVGLVAFVWGVGYGGVNGLQAVSKHLVSGEI